MALTSVGPHVDDVQDSRTQMRGQEVMVLVVHRQVIETLTLRSGDLDGPNPFQGLREHRVGPARNRQNTADEKSPNHDHDSGRTTQMVAGVVSVARAARNNRSSSGTNNDVRAPEDVARRPAASYCASPRLNTSMIPSPHVT